jgi:hypothetical protein
MQRARFVWRLGLLVVLGLSGFLVGCDSGERQAPPLEGKGNGKVFAEERKEQKQDRINAKRAARGLKPTTSPEPVVAPESVGTPAPAPDGPG